MKIYVVFDKKMGSFSTPFFAVNDAVASRMCLGLLRAQGSIHSLCPDDFCLRCIGGYSDSTGLITSFTSPKPISSFRMILKLSEVVDESDEPSSIVDDEIQS